MANIMYKNIFIKLITRKEISKININFKLKKINKQ